jgi:4-hydroxy-tetrahydrodipicolinate synthase
VSESRRRPLRLRGALTALVTPFDAGGGVDRSALERLVRWQIARGIHGLVPCGTTGEAATLTDDEQRQVIETVARVAEGRVPVVAGCGSNDTRRTVEAARRATAAGADALLVVSPYYNKPNRSGMLAHFRAVAEATALPVVVYNVPGRTGQNLGAELTLELAGVPGIVGVKEASGDLQQIAAILAGRPERFAVLSGDDALTLPTVALGAEGVISVVSNEAPAEMAALVEAALVGDLPGARALHYRLRPLMEANFRESNPVPVKVGMALLGLCEERVRAPLGPPAPETRELLRRSIERAALTADAR